MLGYYYLKKGFIIMDTMKNTIGKNIRILRKQRGQTLKSLSNQIGITHQQLSRIENGGGTSATTLERIATVLQVSTSTLLEEPTITLQKSINQTKNYIPEAVCQSMYTKLLSDIIKPINDIAIENYWNEICEKIIQNPKWIKQLIETYAKMDTNKEIYTFTPSELFQFCQCLFVEFASQTIGLSKIDSDELE